MKRLNKLEQLAGSALFFIGTPYTVALIVSLPNLPWNWTKIMTAPYGLADPTRVFVQKSPVLEISLVVGYFIGIGLVNYGLFQDKVKRKWVGFVVVGMLASTVIMALFLAFLQWMIPI